jgi:hypothetical protein
MLTMMGTGIMAITGTIGAMSAKLGSSGRAIQIAMTTTDMTA